MRPRIFAAAAIVLFLATLTRAQDVNDVLEKATKDAVKKVGPSVVQIVTQGGADIVVPTPKGPSFRKALGPTTGVIVSSDGYVISSLFNFLNDPTTILVSVPGREEPFVAKRVANDRSRMLTLLKIEAKGLATPTTSPKNDIHEGQFAIAMGRTLDAKRAGAPSISVGIVSAVGRIWGKAIQTDAKISPVNYGGPLIDLQGRIQGILIPASPQGDDATSGFEWYDSGIGFAIPYEDVLASVEKLKHGKDLHKGILGIRLKGSDLYSGQPEIAMVAADSAGAKAGLKAGDKIVEIDGKPVVRLAQMQHLLGSRYEGDRISLKYKRGEDVKELKDLTLVSSMQGASHAFLGILPLRDDPKLGVEIRYVFPGSPADKAGLKFGERIVKFGMILPAEGPIKKTDALQAFSGVKSGRDQLLDLLNTMPPGVDLSLGIADKNGKERTVTVVLSTLPGSSPGEDWKTPDRLPPGSLGKARDPLEKGKKEGKIDGKKDVTKEAKVEEKKDAKDEAKKDEAKKDEAKKDEAKKDEAKKDEAKKDEAKKDAKDDSKTDDAPRKTETGLMERTTGDGEHKYWVYVPKDYDPDYTYGVVVWLHLAGKNKKADANDLVDLWADYCSENRLVLVMPQSQNADGWIASEADAVIRSVRDAMKTFSVDPMRVVAHGMGVGGQMALHLGMNNRDLIRGVATVGAVPTTIKDNVPNQRLAFWLASGELDPLVKNISEGRTKLAEKRYSAVFVEIANRGREYLEDRQVRDLVRWIDTLDKE
jgi:serine protease Do